MQYEIIAVTPRGEARVFDRRGFRPTRHAFAVDHEYGQYTVAPNLKHAKEVRDAFLAWCPRFGPADVKRVILRKVPRCADCGALLVRAPDCTDRDGDPLRVLDCSAGCGWARVGAL